MAVYVHHYIYKTSDSSFNKPKEEMEPYQRIAYINWNKYCIQVQPGWVATEGPIDIDENTRKITYTIDMLSNNFINPHATDFWKNIHDDNNQFWAAYKSTLSPNSPNSSKFKVTLEKDGVETDIIPLPTV